MKTVYLKSFFEAKTLTGSNFQITDSFILSFWYIIGMINTITGMYFTWRLEYENLPKNGSKSCEYLYCSIRRPTFFVVSKISNFHLCHYYKVPKKQI